MININNKYWDNLRINDIKKFLVSIDDDERYFIEFKEENIRNSQLTKEISAFANSFGGYLFLGVDDNKNIVGCSNKWSELKINTIICNGISPIPKIDIKKYNLNDSKKLFVIKIEEGSNPPYITNEGHIYHRISSSSDRVKDSFTLNNLYTKSKDNLKKIEDKIYIPSISKPTPDNLCGYIDFGFALETKNLNKTTEIIKNANIDKISYLLKENNQKYSISLVGYSIVISIGETRLTQGDKQILTTSGLCNFMEILPDGSFKCRIIISAEQDSSIANISQILTINTLFKKIYKIVFNNKLINVFVEAKWYEKLTVLKLFQPKILVKEDDEFKSTFDNFYNNHLIKYGNNVVINNNRIPMTGFYTIDNSLFSLNKIKFNEENLLNQLFCNPYALLGYIDDFEDEKTSCQKD